MLGYNGIFRAIVYNTNQYIEKGTIDVFIEGVSAEESDFYPAIVKSQFGGLDKSGLISPPPIGGNGYVMFPNGNSSNFAVWMGSPYIPSDKNTDQSENAKITLPPEVNDPSTIVLRTQYTKKEKGGEDLTSKNNKVESIVIINEKEFTFSKPKTDDSLYTYDSKSYTISEKKHNSLIIKDDQIFIKYYEKSGKEFSIKLTDTLIELKYSNNEYIRLSADGIILKAEKSIINLPNTGKLSMKSDQYIKFYNTNDNFLKWSVFNELITAFNQHTHAPGSDSPKSGTPMPVKGRSSLIISTGMSIGVSSISEPLEKYIPKKKMNTRVKMNRDIFKGEVEIIGENKINSTALSTGSSGGGFGGLFGTCYTDAVKIKSKKNKL